MSWRNLVWMTIVLCLAGLALYLSRRKPARLPRTDPALAELAGAVKAYKLIKEHSYHELTPLEASRGAVEGMIRQTDRFSLYIPPGKAAPFSRRVTGKVEETGLRIGPRAGRLFVVGPLPGSPAQKAGLFGGVEILAVDGVAATELELEEARRQVATPAAGKVSLRLRTAEGDEVVRELETARFDVETVTGVVLDHAGRWAYTLDRSKRIYYVRISEFVGRTPSELQRVYRKLDDPAGVVLDLRDNPGGMLPAAAEVADRFLTEGLIVRTVSRRGHLQVRYAHADGTYPAVPVVVLINADTASAAEIVAGALQVHGRALLLGETSYGKWWVQNLFRLPHALGRAYLTTAEYFLAEPEPSTQPTQPATRPASEPGRQRAGLQPDVSVAIPPGSLDRLALLRLRARVVKPPQRGGTLATGPRSSENLKRSILALDVQLSRALELLRERRVPTTRPAGTTRWSLTSP